jgi:hemoglobin
MTQNLYERLGGPSGVDKLVDRIVDLHLENKRIATRYGHLDQAGLTRTRTRAKEFFTVGTGGPGTYTGRSMPEVHAGMNIDAEEFLAVLDDMMKAMNELEYPRAVCDEVLGIAYSLKGEIVHK